MVLMRAFALLALLLVAVLGFTPEVDAHKNHQQERVEERDDSGAPSSASALREGAKKQVEEPAEARPGTFSQRLASWLGRTHPFAVHFPIALFPISLVALILARRRGETVELIRSLIIVAGASAVLASLLGWLSGGFALDGSDPIQLWHRWIGTGLALAGAAIAFRAWRRRDSVNVPGMVVALAAITLALMLQGWLGAALVHGADHMSF